MVGKKVLVIDDCKLTLAVANDILAAEGYEVALAEASFDAYPLIFSRNPPDLIMMDVEMPTLNGDRVVKVLKSRPRSQNIPILLISSKSREDLAPIAERSGANGYLCKPLEPETLLPRVRRMIMKT